jgi:hypothetical protein
MILISVITCPHCATFKAETMAADACQFFYVCTGCGAKLRPRPGDCCVFCSYGSVPCPPVQAERAGGNFGSRRGRSGFSRDRSVNKSRYAPKLSNGRLRIEP